MSTTSLRSDRELSVSDVPLTIGGCLAAVAVAEVGTSTPSPFRMWSVVTPVAEAGTSTPSPFRMWFLVTPVAETIIVLPLMIVPMHVTVIVPVLKSITPIIAMLVLIGFVRALSCSAVVTSHSRAVHRGAIHLPAVAGPYAATMEATTAARQPTRATRQRFG